MEDASEVQKKQKQLTKKKKKKKQRVKAHHIPIEIVKEILDRLPLKSLARFKCVSKRWHSLTKTIIRRRFREEWRRVMPKYLEARRSMDGLNGGGAEDSDSDEGLGAGRARLKDGLEEMQSVVDFLDGIDRYLPERGDAYHMLRDSVVCWVRSARDLLADVDAFSDDDDSD